MAHIGLRPATHDDTPAIAALVVGSPEQASTAAAMRLFGLADLDQTLTFATLMAGSTEAWRSTTVAEDAGTVVGMVQLGEAFPAFTPEIAEFARSIHGPAFQEILGPRLAALGAVQSPYPDGSLLVSELHVAPSHRRSGVGRLLMDHAIATARSEGATSVALQTLVTNPARFAFEAYGFEVVATTTSAEYEAITGVPGNLAMVLTLDT